MPNIFISYARKSQEFASRLARDLEGGGADVFLDVDDIAAGSNWSNSIQQGLDSATVMLVIITPESMKSRNVSEEWQYYIDEGKPIIPLLLNPAKIHFQLRRMQYIDFHTRDYNQAYVHLLTALKKKQVKLLFPEWYDPKKYSDEPTIPTRTPQASNSRWGLFMGFGLLFIVVIAVALLLFVLGGDGDDPNEVADLPTSTVTATFNSRQIVLATLNAEQTATIQARRTATRQGEINLQRTEIFEEFTQTALARTLEATISETIVVDEATETHVEIDTNTNTAIPEPSNTLIPTMTNTIIPSPEPTDTATLIPTITPLPATIVTEVAILPTNTATPVPLGFDGNYVGTNAEWTPQRETFNGVVMVLVPAGCFDMGVDGIRGEVCFDNPFWVDETEVSNAQFDRFNGEARLTSRNQGINNPREVIYWDEAVAFCELRGGRLPTEAEWEYSARGPDNLLYPWGNEFDANNVIYNQNSGGFSTGVGERSGGMSWVGALDMSGNVWEWTDGGTSSGRINRGGSFDFFGGSPFADDNLLITAIRTLPESSTAFYNIGFRCARDYQVGN